MGQYDANGLHSHEERQDRNEQRKGRAVGWNDWDVDEAHQDPVRNQQSIVKEYIAVKPDTRRESHRKPWYNQGWLWLIVAVIGIAVVGFALLGLSGEAANISNSVKEQTGVLREQTGVLTGIRDSLGHIVASIDYGFQRVADAIRAAMDRISAG